MTGTETSQNNEPIADSDTESNSMTDVEFALMKLDSVRSYGDDIPETVPGDDRPRKHFNDACDGLERAIQRLSAHENASE